MEIRKLFDTLLQVNGPENMSMDSRSRNGARRSFYGRTVYHGVLRHNDRINTVNKLMHTYNNVNKYLMTKNGGEEALIDRLV